jgi:hypothetical protein
MHRYPSESARMIERFEALSITGQECLAALDSAVAAALRTASPRDLKQLRRSAVRDYLIVQTEIARRRRF